MDGSTTYDNLPGGNMSQDFEQAYALLPQFANFELADERYPSAPQTVFTTAVLMWMLIMQRMSADLSIEQIIKRLLLSMPHFLPENKRLQEQTLSTATGGYTRARLRMMLESVRWFVSEVTQSLVKTTQPTFEGYRVFTIDGTTITLAPEPELRQAFPPAENQHGVGPFPVALLVVTHELASGAALIPEVGAMFGEQAVSETALVKNCLAQLPANAVVMADAGYGIFSVAYQINSHGHQLLLRLTQARFKSHLKRAVLTSQQEQSKSWSLCWQPSPTERKTNPDLPARAELNVFLHEIIVSPELTLHLVTTLPHTASELAALYERRNDIETDLRALKVVLQTEKIRARKVDTFMKELLMSIVAYNLIVQFRRQAAAINNQPPRSLSFKRVHSTYTIMLQNEAYNKLSPQAWQSKYDKALKYASKDKLPHRPNRRYPREAYQRRAKNAHFKNRSHPDLKCISDG